MSENLFLKTRFLVLPACLVLASACTDSGSDNDGGEDALEIIGSYTDDFGGSHEISTDTWTMDGIGVFHLSSFDNEAGYVVAQNDADNEYNADQWSRMDWTYDGDDLYFCQPVFDAESEEDAVDAPGADADDLATGCGTFAWSQLSPN
jgi:hypothetical protein